MRTLKPEAASSESLAEVDRGIRWTFGMFWTHCDDEGRAVWNLRLIKAAIYPLDDHITIAVLADDFANLERIGAVCRYEVDGKEYVHVPAFGEHQHPNRRVESKLPPCPKTDHSPTPHAQRSEDSVSTHEPSTSVVVVEGRGDVEGGGGVARAERAPTARDIVARWVDQHDEKPPKRIIGQVAQQVGEMLHEGIDPDTLIRGLVAWTSKGLAPSALPSFVHEAQNRPRLVSRQQDETDAMFERAAIRMGVVK